MRHEVYDKTAVLLDNEKRFSYHAPFGTQISRYVAIRAKAKDLADMLVMLCPPSRELSTALTHLDSVVMFANAAIARNEQP
jgi:hypothetical protein